MAQRILGMGDITTLVERAQEQYDEEQARKLEKKIRKNQFDFEDFRNQLQQIKKMGNIKDLLGMMPGIGKAVKDIDISDDAFNGIEAIINSMTPYERANPPAIDGSRRKRIARGSGKDMEEINQLFKQFDQIRKMMKQMNNANTGKKNMRMPGIKK
jgi:signal recognition particle subunit SRP54